MKMKNPMLVVKNMEQAKVFYGEVLGLHVIADLGEDVVLSGGLALQTEKSWREFTDKEIAYEGNDSEIYFEEDDFDGFLKKLKELPDIDYVHEEKEHRWGQRVVRFYDPDKHIIEVGENMKAVCKRFFDQGMTHEEIAERMGVPMKMVKGYLR